MPPSPSARKLMAESGVTPIVDGSGKRGQVLKEDVLAAAMARPTAPPSQRRRAGSQPSRRLPPSAEAAGSRARRRRRARPVAVEDARREERVQDDPPAPDHRAPAQGCAEHRRHAHHLQRGGHEARSWTLRTQYKEAFEKKHGVKLGFMGFFTKAVVHALKEIPTVNAEIDGDEIVYKNYAHIGVAVGTDRGLVVPVVRNADQLVDRRHREGDQPARQARPRRPARHGRHAGRHLHHLATAASTAR